VNYIKIELNYHSRKLKYHEKRAYLTVYFGLSRLYMQKYNQNRS